MACCYLLNMCFVLLCTGTLIGSDATDVLMYLDACKFNIHKHDARAYNATEIMCIIIKDRRVQCNSNTIFTVLVKKTFEKGYSQSTCQRQKGCLLFHSITNSDCDLLICNDFCDTYNSCSHIWKWRCR